MNFVDKLMNKVKLLHKVPQLSKSNSTLLSSILSKKWIHLEVQDFDGKLLKDWQKSGLSNLSAHQILKINEQAHELSLVNIMTGRLGRTASGNSYAFVISSTGELICEFKSYWQGF